MKPYKEIGITDIQGLNELILSLDTAKKEMIKDYLWGIPINRICKFGFAFEGKQVLMGNDCPGAVSGFYEALGVVKPDEEKLRYYMLLDEMSKAHNIR